MSTTPIYIPPNLNIFQSYEDLKNNKPSDKYKWYLEKERMSIEDILKHQRVVILADPGYGKTELLNQIINISSQKDLKSILINLKNLDYTKNLSENIINKAKRPDIDKTYEFRLEDQKNIIVCLDALDEVTTTNLPRVLEMIKDFLSTFPNVNTYLTCRRLYFNSFYQEFSEFKFQFISIECFIHDQIYKYLKANNFTESQIDSVFDNFSNRGNISVIQTPRYLNLLVKYVKENKDKKLEKLTRCQLFEYFVYNKLDKEKSVLGKVDINLMKRVLETLALTMEIYQTNILTKDELMTFFRDIKNDLKINILSQITLDEFIDKSILKNNIETIEFDNTEFQEYLAAKEIQRFNKISMSVFDLAVNKDLREIYPSWFNVLSYLIEMKIDLLEEIVEFGMSGDKTIVDGYFKLVTDVNVNLLSDSIRDRIFKGALEYHQENQLTLDPFFCRNLTHYYTPNNWRPLIKYLEKRYVNTENQRIQVRNVFYIFYDLIKNHYLNEEEIKYVSNKFVSTIRNKSIPVELKEEILFLSEYVKDKRILKLLEQFKREGDKDILHTLINAAGNIDINNKITLELIIEAIHNHSTAGSHEMFDLTSKKTIKALFKRLNSDVYLIDNLHEATSDSYSQKSLKGFIETLQSMMDKELTELILDFIVKSFHKEVQYSRYSNILKELIVLVSRKREKLIFELMNEFSNRKDEIYSFEIVQAFVLCLKKNQIKKFIKEIQMKFPEDSWIAFNTLFNCKYSKRDDGQEMYEEGRKFFEHEYAEADKAQSKSKQQDKKGEERNYRNFIEVLDQSTPKKYFLNIFQHYSLYHQNIDPYLKQIEREKLLELTNIFLKTYNPAISGLEITEVKNDTTSYRTDRNIQFYGEAIICAKLLSINVNEFRQNIINYIPFSYHHHLEAIFSIVDNISNQEVAPILEIYSKKTDDLWRFMPDNFLRIVELLNLSETQSVLEEFVETKDLRTGDQFYRLKALKLADSFKNNKEYLKNIIRKYENDDTGKGIVNEAYKILIQKYLDEDAINLRFQQIVADAFEFERIMGAHGISPQESELTDKRFAMPIMEINEVKYIDLYLHLLDSSYLVQNRGKNYFDYANYMREIVIAYFRNLRIHRKFEYFVILKKATEKFSNEIGYGWFLKNIGLLKNQYLEYIGKPANISECIQQYNEIKKRQYIEISNTRELANAIKNLIKNDLNTWMMGEGVKILEGFKKSERANETELQKLIKIQFENILFKNGFTPSEQINLYREVQSLDDKKPDFLITYGFVKPIILELKMSNHSELKMSDLSKGESYKNLTKYINNLQVEHCFFLVYENQKREPSLFKEQLRKVITAYQKISNVEVIGIPE